jgi:hypothetical protein
VNNCARGGGRGGGGGRSSGGSRGSSGSRPGAAGGIFSGSRTSYGGGGSRFSSGTRYLINHISFKFDFKFCFFSFI